MTPDVTPISRRQSLRYGAAGLAGWLGQIPWRAFAQETWPTRPVRLIVSSSPGGGTDLYARMLAQALGDVLKQQFVVENRPGASGNIGAAAVAKSPPDGYTFLVSANTSLTINSSLYKNLTYDAERDFVPIIRAFAPLVLVVHPSTKARNLAELIELGKREPGKTSFGSAGTGSTTYLGVRMLEEKTGARFLHVPYKGVGPAYQDLLAGQLNFLFPDVASALSLIKAGKIIPIASEQRTPLLPGLPTLAEAGMPDVSTNSSFSLVAPTGTPVAVIDRMHREAHAITKSAGFAAKLESQGLVGEIESLTGLAASMKKERDAYAAFIKRNSIVPSD
ncbi:MAG: tripartite tricarboxylate transporter substrate binding protein [Betaproteobacteria bacterium]|nr:tripartite tricarboxylate transporter substrate binding protein [Betaproteobacteria bacterium]NBY06327.1 tripartite tricarboxylate transporter substrate binding protein [Betaproteobacteria bacterium]